MQGGKTEEAVWILKIYPGEKGRKREPYRERQWAFFERREALFRGGRGPFPKKREM